MNIDMVFAGEIKNPPSNYCFDTKGQYMGGLVSRQLSHNQLLISTL